MFHFTALHTLGTFPHDERVEALPEVALPARHRGDVRLHRGVSVRLRDLRVAAREEDDLLAFSHLDRLGLTRTWLRTWNETTVAIGTRWGRPQTTMACPTAATVPSADLQRLFRDESLALAPAFGGDLLLVVGFRYDKLAPSSTLQLRLSADAYAMQLCKQGVAFELSRPILAGWLEDLLGRCQYQPVHCTCSVFLGRSSRNQSSKDMAFPHPQSRKDHYRKEDKPNCVGILWNFFNPGRPGRPAPDPAGSPTAPCAGGSPLLAGVRAQVTTLSRP